MHDSAPAVNRWLVLTSAVVSFFTVAVTFFAVPPLAPELTSRFGFSNSLIGLLVGSIAVPAIFLSIPLGSGVDRWPPRAAGNAGLVIMLLGAVLFAAAPNYAFLLTGRLIFGIGGLIINLLLARVLSEVFEGKELALAMGIFMAVYPAGMIVIFSSHSFLVSTFGWRGELVILAGLAALALPLHNLAVPRRLRSDDTERSPSRVHGLRVGRPLLLLALSWMLFFAAFASVPTFAPQWIGGGQRALTTVTLIMWGSMILSPVFGALIDRTDRPIVWIGGGFVLMTVTLTLMAGNIVRGATAMILVGISAASVPTAVYALPARIVPAARVGFAFGFITAFSNLGTVWGPTVAGAVLDATGDWRMMWMILAVLSALGAAVAAPIRRASR